MYRYFISYVTLSPMGFGSFELRWPAPISGHKDIEKITRGYLEQTGRQISILNWQLFEGPAVTR